MVIQSFHSDGADLLHLSMKYNTHMSLIPAPLALRLEGFRGRLRGLREILLSLTKVRAIGKFTA
jgi:hypothetical protein